MIPSSWRPLDLSPTFPRQNAEATALGEQTHCHAGQPFRSQVSGEPGPALQQVRFERRARIVRTNVLDYFLNPSSAGRPAGNDVALKSQCDEDHWKSHQNPAAARGPHSIFSKVMTLKIAAGSVRVMGPAKITARITVVQDHDKRQQRGDDNSLDWPAARRSPEAAETGAPIGHRAPLRTPCPGPRRSRS